MRLLKTLFIFTFCTGASLVHAQDNPASPEKIRELLEITEARNVVGQMTGQIRQLMDQSVSTALQGHQLTADQQKVLDEMTDDIIDVMEEELDWDILEPLYIRIYQNALTEGEVQGMIEIYKTPAGQAMIKKLPLIMQETMLNMQQRMGPMMEKLQAIQQRSLAKMQALETP
jgi:hypothetical protein